jgi:peptide/nickel transport system substrate-binding protein
MCSRASRVASLEAGCLILARVLREGGKQTRVWRLTPHNFLITLFLLIALLLSACSKHPDGKTVVMIIESSPANLDPRVGTDAQSQRISDLIFDSLVHRDDHFQMQPWLAESWDISPDGLTYTFHLRHGVRFHDGKPLTAQDVKWTFDSIRNGNLISVKKATYRSVESIDAPDDQTVVFHLKQPDATLLFNLSNASMGIVPYGADRNFASKLIGSGPFKFVSQAQDDYVLLERNTDYWAGAPKVERVRFAVVPDTTTRVLELRKGSADIEINAVTADMVEAVRRNDGDKLVIKQAPGTSYQYLALNLRDPALKDVRVRQALAYAIDVQPIIHFLMRDLARPADSILPPQHWAYNADVTQYTRNLQRAIALLENSGYKPDAHGVRLRLTMKTSTEEAVRLLAAILQSQLRQVGIELDIRSFEFATFYSDVVKGSYQLYSLRWVGGSNQDPDIFSYAFDSSRMPPNGANRSYYANPEVDRLIAAGRSTIDPVARKVDYAKIQQIVARDLPYINLWYMDNVIVHTRRIRNLHIPVSGNYEFLREIEVAE